MNIHPPVQVLERLIILTPLLKRIFWAMIAQNFGYLKKLLIPRLFQKAAGNPMDDAFFLSKPCIQLALWSHPQL